MPYVFQFHYGTIKSLVSSLFMTLNCRFNSTMVRLKERVVAAGMGFFDVSIPLWLKGGASVPAHQAVQFQFHYGTIKRRRICASTSSCTVSIPLWYD